MTHTAHHPPLVASCPEGLPAIHFWSWARHAIRLASEAMRDGYVAHGRYREATLRGTPHGRAIRCAFGMQHQGEERGADPPQRARNVALPQTFASAGHSDRSPDLTWE